MTSNAYVILDRESIPEYLGKIPEVKDLLGNFEDLTIDEIGDGNLNFVFRVTNSSDNTRSVIVKQAVPYLRMAGESWPLDRDRMRYEIRALQTYNQLVPHLVPKIFHADEEMSTLVMQCLDEHIILRIGMIDGIKYPDVGEHIGEFMAETLFRTSAWAMSSVERRKLMNQFVLNAELCQLTEEFIFTFPYFEQESNYSNPATDLWCRDNIHNDQEYKRSVLRLKDLFVSKTEALLHGDLHSGSMMVNEKETYVIDMEFAFFGPMSFDVGKVIANFLLCCTAHFHRSEGEEYRNWILAQVQKIWQTFESRFLALWENHMGDSTLYVSEFLTPESLSVYRQEFMVEMLQDAAGFAACSMARRTVGIAGVADIRDIEDLEIRSSLEIANLKLSKKLMEKRGGLSNIDDLLDLVNEFYSTTLS